MTTPFILAQPLHRVQTQDTTATQTAPLTPTGTPTRNSPAGALPAPRALGHRPCLSPSKISATSHHANAEGSSLPLVSSCYPPARTSFHTSRPASHHRSTLPGSPDAPGRARPSAAHLSDISALESQRVTASQGGMTSDNDDTPLRPATRAATPTSGQVRALATRQWQLPTTVATHGCPC